MAERIIIADDHPLFRMGLKFALQEQGFTIVAEASDGQAAVQQVKLLAPDVVLLDVKMPKLDGIAACRQIRQSLNTPPMVIMLTTFEEPAIIQAAQQAGASGYVSKETSPSALAVLIRKILAEPERNWIPRVDVPSLTQRERQVLEHLAQGKSNKAIAKALSLSPETIKDYVNGIYGKLDVRDRISAVQRAHELGLLESRMG